MRVYIKGNPKKTSVQEIKSATKYMLSLLLTKKQIKSITSIHIEFTKIKDFAGTADIHDDYGMDKKKYVVAIDERLSRKLTLETLAHELVHVKQYHKKELDPYIYQNKFHRWNNQYVKDSVEYWDQPWEIEAYGRTPGLIKRYTDHLKTSK